MGDGFSAARRAVEFSEARGLRENLAWGHYVGVELGLGSGEWDEAIIWARRAFDVGVANGYDRAVLRTWSALLPIAAARGDEGLAAHRRARGNRGRGGNRARPRHPRVIDAVALGCGNFGGIGSAPELFGRGESEEEAVAVMDAAWQQGIRWFDTADAYGGGR